MRFSACLDLHSYFQLKDFNSSQSSLFGLRCVRLVVGKNMPLAIILIGKNIYFRKI